jgi:hypothetical protein
MHDLIEFPLRGVVGGRARRPGMIFYLGGLEATPLFGQCQRPRSSKWVRTTRGDYPAKAQEVKPSPSWKPPMLTPAPRAEHDRDDLHIAVA